MTTFAELKTEVSEALRDPSNLTFDDTAVGRMVNMAIAEIGRIAPRHFQEDIQPVVDTLEYGILADYFDDVETPEIELMRVELWDTTVTPNKPVKALTPASSQYAADSQTGWANWGGVLHIPYRIWSLIDGNEGDYLFRLWGYSPYLQLEGDDDVFDGSVELRWAVVTYSQVVALRRLASERELFTQWQTRSGNSDISPAGLMSDYNLARDEWRRTKHELYRHRSKV